MAIPQISSSNTFGQWLTATQSLINKQNYLEDSANALYAAANSTINVANSATNTYNNTVSVYSNTLNVFSNTVNVYSDTANVFNNIQAYVNVAFNAANTSYNVANDAYNTSNSALLQANLAISLANGATANIFTVQAFNQANSAFDQANAAFLKANTFSVNTFISVIANGTYINAVSNSSTFTINPGPNAKITTVGTTITIDSLASGGGGTGVVEPTASTLALRDSNGNLYANNFISSSDIRLKDNVETLQNALNIVQNLRGVTFTWKNTTTQQIGLIAQEVETILPSIVYGNDMKSVNYVVLTAVLIEAVKELSNRLDKLEK